MDYTLEIKSYPITPPVGEVFCWTAKGIIKTSRGNIRIKQVLGKTQKEVKNAYVKN